MLEKFPEQIKEAFNLTNLRIRNYEKIAVCGMGGSGIGGYILRDLIDKPVFVIQDYKLPKFIDKNTLVFVMSYSGNTKETISMYKEAKRRTKKLVVISSGGILGKVKGAILVPDNLQPRHALAYLFFPMWKILGKNLGDVLEVLKKVKKDLGIAKKLYGKLPVIYTNHDYYSLALRWRKQINEDAKRLVVTNKFPELNHNEIESRYKNAVVVFLKDKEEKAIRFLEKETKVIEVRLKGRSKIAKMFYGIYLGDYVSLKLARLYKEDYLNYRIIEKLKKR